MKKIYLAVTIVLSLSNFVKAQNASPYWSLAGNSNATRTSKLGTTNGINLRLYTNNLERARLTASGLFGIGTTNPVTKLQVNGFGSFGNQVTTLNATRALNLADANAVIRVLRVHPTNAPAVELISRTSADGANVAYWDAYAQPTDASFRIRDRQAGKDLDRITITHIDGNVGIGTTAPVAKLDVIGSATGISTTGGDFGIQASADNSNGTGVKGFGHNIGVYGIGESGDRDITAFGVKGSSNSGVGVEGYSYDGIAGSFYSEYGAGLTATSGEGTSNAAEFNGDVYCSGTVYQSSDKNLKTNIQELRNAMSIINKLKPRNYEFKKEARLASLSLPKGIHYGLIAQELEEVLPNLVKESRHQLKSAKDFDLKLASNGKTAMVARQKEATDSINTKAVNYIELIPIIIKAMQEQNSENKEQKITIQKLNAKVEELTKLVNRLSLNTSISSSSKLSGVSLGQSIPNPNSTSTKISYNIPGGFSKGKLVISNEAGQEVRQMQLNNSGIVDINTSGLSAGAYLYTLFVDGKAVDSKKMVVIRH